jgi:hypothetical protein
MLSRDWLFCNPMNYSLPSFSVHGIFQARILEWVAISYPVFLFKDTLFYTLFMYSWFMNTELTANSTITHAWKNVIEHMNFSVKQDSLVFRNIS